MTHNPLRVGKPWDMPKQLEFASSRTTGRTENTVFVILGDITQGLSKTPIFIKRGTGGMNHHLERCRVKSWSLALEPAVVLSTVELQAIPMRLRSHV